MQEKQATSKKSTYVFELIKALIFSVIVTLVLVLLAALIIKFFSVSTSAIPIINQVIKGVSIFLSAIIFFKQKGAGFFRGLILGVAYILLSSFIFSLFNGSFSFGINVLNDLTFSAVTGLISGIVAVNVKK